MTKKKICKEKVEKSKSTHVKEPAKIGNIPSIALSPAARAFGYKVIPASERLADSVNITFDAAFQVLKPILELTECAGLSMGVFTRKLKEKINSISPEDIIEPRKRIFGPAINVLQDCEEDEEISNMFANLIANSMDKNTYKISHPSFVSIIQQITPDEARILRLFESHVSYPVFDIFAMNQDKDVSQYFATNVTNIAEVSGCNIPELSQTYIDNLCRLYLVRKGGQCLDQDRCDILMNHKIVSETLKHLEEKNKTPLISKTAITITDFGRKFLTACLINKEDYKTKIESDKLITNPYI